MKRLVLLFALCLSYFSHSQTPEVDWVSAFNTFVSGSNGYINDIEPCESGGVYILVSFYGNYDVNPFNYSEFYLTSNGESDIAVIRLNEFGHLVWAKQFGGLLHEFGNKLAKSGSGDLYVSGIFKDSVDFDPGPNEENAFSNGDLDGFILSLDSNGIYLNSKTFGGAGYDAVFEIDFDENDQCYVSGRFDDSVNLNPNGNQLIQLAPNGAGTFIAKSNDDFQFEPIISMDAGEYNGIYDFEISENNQIHYVNYFSDTLNASFQNTTFQKISNGSVDVLYGITDLAGNNDEYIHFGGPHYDIAYSIAEMSNDKFAMFVKYEDSLKFDLNGTDVYVRGNNIGWLSNSSLRNTAILKFDGVEVEWINTVNVQTEGGNSSGVCSPYDNIKVDEHDNLYMALSVDGVCSVNQSNMNTFGSHNSSGTVLTIQNSDGVFTGLKCFTGWGGISTTAIEIIDDDLFLGSGISGDVDFDLTESVFAPFVNGLSLAKYNLQDQFLLTNELSENENDLYPNPTNEILNLKVPQASNLIIHDLSGRKIEPVYQYNGESYQINTSQLVNGVYTLSFQEGNSFSTEKFIVQH